MRSVVHHQLSCSPLSSSLTTAGALGEHQEGCGGDGSLRGTQRDWQRCSQQRQRCSQQRITPPSPVPMGSLPWVLVLSFRFSLRFYLCPRAQVNIRVVEEQRRLQDEQRRAQVGSHQGCFPGPPTRFLHLPAAVGVGALAWGCTLGCVPQLSAFLSPPHHRQQEEGLGGQQLGRRNRVVHGTLARASLSRCA